jgi:hypothetical protein
MRMHRLKLVGGTDTEMGSCGADTGSVPRSAAGEPIEPYSLGDLVFAVVMRCGDQFTLIEAQAGSAWEEDELPAC